MVDDSHDEQDILDGVDEVDSLKEEGLDFEAYLARATEAADVSTLPITETAPDDPDAPVFRAEENVTNLEVISVELAGHTEKHVLETSKTLEVSEEWMRQSNEAYLKGVNECTPEQIIKRIHDLEHLRWLIPAQQFGWRHALEDLLKNETAESRKRLLELDKGFHVKHERRVKGKLASTPRVKSSRPARPSASGKSKGMKTADTLKGCGFDQTYIETQVETLHQMDEQTALYIDKLFTE